MAFDRMIDHANALVASLGIVDPPEDAKPEVKALHRLTKISELDAKRWVVKTLRELRHAVAVGGTVKLDEMAEALAKHLAEPVQDDADPGKHAEAVKAWEKRVAAQGAKIKAVLETEKTAFEDHVIEQGEALGEHAVFHEDHGIIDGRLYDDNQMPLSARLNKAAFSKAAK